jgi:phenylacetate-CoA ligase
MPHSIRIRKFFATRSDLARDVFGESRLPSLVQYDPLSRYFEVYKGTPVVSGDNGVPLVRYHIADKRQSLTRLPHRCRFFSA